MNARRPKAGEDEDDLLKLQAQFLQSGQTSVKSAGVTIKKPDKRSSSDNASSSSTRDIVKMDISEKVNIHPIPTKKSKFQRIKNEDVKHKDESGKGDPMDEDAIEELLKQKDTGLAAVLTSIIERDTRNEIASAPILSGQGFPSVNQNDRIHQNAPISVSNSSDGKTQKKKKSLFAQHVEAKSAQHFGVPQQQMSRKLDLPKYTSDKSVASSDLIPDKSYIVSGHGLSGSHNQIESQRIHEENMHTLSSMPESEILEEQRNLLESADPMILKFLKSKREKQKLEGNNVVEEMPEACSTFNSSSKIKFQARNKEEADCALPLEPSSDWVNMGVIEKEKMEWMSDLPPPDSVSSQTGKPARFDFDGKVLAVDSDIPVNRGLHHHGDEPERAGYTLQELFTLARSTNLQQRVLALHTVAKIIKMAKCGALVNKIESPLIPALLDGGVVILIRLALDDPVEGVVFAAIDAFHSLLCSPLDQEAVSKTWIHHLGNILPSLVPAQTLQKQSEPEDPDEDNEEQETDADVVKRDVLLALVTRMQLLPRFHYILESMRPQAVVVKAIIDILARVSQHSSNMSYEITKSAGLISKIVKEFLPTAWNPQDATAAVSNVYGLPVPSALRLVRCLCQAGRHITATLIANHHLLRILIRYLAVDVSCLHLPSLEAEALQTEALAVWRVCVTYGYGLQIFFDLYSDNVKKIGILEKEWRTAHLSENVERNSFMKESGLVCVLERILYTTEKQHQEGSGQPTVVSTLPINWSHVTCLFQPIRACVCQMLSVIGQDYPVKKQNLSLPTACVNFLASFYETEDRQAGIDVLSRGEDLENFTQDCLNPFLSSFGFSVLVDNLCPYSNIWSSKKPLHEENTPSLPSMGVCWMYSQEANLADDEEDVKTLNLPILRELSPYGFIVSVFRLTLNICKRHKALIEKLIIPLVNNPSILSYMRKVCQVPDSTSSLSIWTRSENLLQFFWLKCCLLTPCEDMTLAHRMSLRLLSRLQGGDEYVVHDLFTSTIFSPLFIREGEEIQLTSQSLANMNLSEGLYLKSATQDEIDVSQSQLLKQAYASLATIRGHFLMALGGMEKAVMQSRSIHCGKPSAVQCQLLSNHGESLMPRDWMYLPLIHVYNKSQQMKGVPNTSMPSQDISMLTSAIQWNYIYEVWRPKEIDHTSITTKVSRLMCAFLAGNDLFLEKRVQKFLAGLLREFVCPRLLNALNFEEKVPGISSFYDLYQEFLDHYEGVSFGDPVFGLYVLLPLQQKHNSLYRKAVWGERRKLLRTLRVSFHDCLIPVENFFEPEEEDVELLQLYLHALTTNSVQPAWSPVMYLVAVHHVNRFIFVTYDDGKQKIRQGIWKIIMDNFEKLSSVIHYKKFNIKANHGLELYDVLPENRKAVLNMHAVNQSN